MSVRARPVLVVYSGASRLKWLRARLLCTWKGHQQYRYLVPAGLVRCQRCGRRRISSSSQIKERAFLPNASATRWPDRIPLAPAALIFATLIVVPVAVLTVSGNLHYGARHPAWVEIVASLSTFGVDGLAVTVIALLRRSRRAARSQGAHAITRSRLLDG